jgi:phosphopantothenoylcysteine decarboxylase / phosphopantothenate---cysteine ligase
MVGGRAEHEMDPTDRPLDGRFIVLGVTGGIAAYKAVEVCRRLVDLGAHVAPVLTEEATRFVGALTFSALASEPCRTQIFDGDEAIPHTRLGQSADIVVVAPATARFIAAYAMGLSDNLLTATVIATRAPVVVCPAMHTEMWEHPSVQENVATLRRRGVEIVWPDEGRLAGGDSGPGRLAEPAEIVAAVSTVLAGLPLSTTAGSSKSSDSSDSPAGGTRERDLEGLNVLVTAGGTREPIDPVRFISNRSSGKQGHAVAQAAAERGALVTLVTASGLPAPGVAQVVRVDTAAEMEHAVLERAGSANVVVMAAAVADFRPKLASEQKLRKQHGVPDLILEPTVDILAELGRRRREGQVLVGFAAETDEVLERAAHKLAAKGVDVMVSNDVTADGAGFEHDTNTVTIIVSETDPGEVVYGAKSTVAHAVLDTVARILAGYTGENPKVSP